MKQINVGLLGFGTVGAGVAKILLNRGALLRSRLGAELNLKRIADIDITTDRDIELADGILTTDAAAVIEDPEIDIIVEMIGGLTVAKTFILQAISNGKQVVTANKALLASHGNELMQKAAEKGVDLAYEASVGGCMPIIKSVRESLVGNQITGMIGILNGTCNYILSKITEDGSQFSTALAEAQAKGYAEADPGLDIDGLDTAHKLAILTAIAYGMQINLADIYTEGISNITPEDIEFAGQFGYRIKLLAITKHLGEMVEARIHPTMIPFDNMLSNVNSTLNAIMVSADAVDKIMLYGHGAGMMPTASAVIADLVDIARNLMACTPNRVPLLAYQSDNIRTVPILPIEEIHTHYYMRFLAMDRPGVLSKISGILGEHQISIKSAYQKGRKTNGTVPLVMLTHRAKEADVNKALEKIDSLDVVEGYPVKIRIEDESNED